MQPKKFDFQLYKKVIQLTRPYRGTLWICAILAVAIAPISSLRPYLVNVMVDDHIMKMDALGLSKMALLLIGFLVIESLLRYYFIYATGFLGQSVIRDLRSDVFRHITNLRMRYFDQTPIGTSTTRTINDLETINSVFSEGLITIIADILALLAVLIMMFATSYKLTLICLTTMPILLIATYFFKESVRKSFQKVRTQIAIMNAFLQERISGMRIVQIFNAERQEAVKFKKINRDYTKANLDSIFAYALFFPAVEIISAASLGLMVWWGSAWVLESEVTLGALIAFPIYINMLFRPIRMLADKFNTLQMGLVASERVFNLLETPDFIPNKGVIKADNIKGAITFDEVDFAYDTDYPILKKVSFSINAGETLAIVGPTGSGKSTMINLLSRFYERDGGLISVDQIPIEDYELHSLRSKIAVVLQDVFLFSGTIFDNISLRNEHISREQMIQAAKMIHAHDFIMRLPNNYEFQVSERGSNLSMGQRQLISFVRAMVYDPAILVLDEATSSIDNETEAVIQFAIETLIKKRSSIIIAHRLSTIRHANKILVLEQGEVVEFGTHDDLMQRTDGHYRELYENQFMKMVESE